MIMSDDEKRMKGAAMLDELRSVVGMFLTEFAAFESMYLSVALRTLAYDPVLVDCLEELMDLEKRLRLLKHLAEARRLPPKLMTEVNDARKAAIKLLERRNEVAHGAAVIAGASYQGLHSEGIEAGVRLAKSKRKGRPVENLDELIALSKSWHRSTADIRGYIAETFKLQEMMKQLAVRLGTHRLKAVYPERASSQ
jgi:hypothetical protein